MTAAELARELNGQRIAGGWRCPCPAHDDHEPSLEITEKNGKLVFICRAGCDQKAVIAELRLRGLWEAVESDKRRSVVATYGYRDEHGALRYEVVRYDPKDFKQRRPNGSDNTFIWNMKGVTPLPYRLPDLLADPQAMIYIVEGERDVDNLAAVGIVATCNNGGAGKWAPEISPWLAGRRVVVIPDNDDAGRAHARDVTQKLAGIAAHTRILELPDLPPKGDISDWLARGGAVEELDRLAAAASGSHDRATANARDLLPGQQWLDREISEPDFLLGEVLSTTSRVEIIGPTGLGKTNLLTAVGIAVADGRDFLHWRGGGRPRHVLYLDGEMSRRLAKKRLVDAARRHGGMPATFFFMNREDFQELGPLNTEPGQKFVDALIDAIGGVDLVIFDNVQALLTGDMKEEEPWQQTLPWVRDLTRRDIGQIWAHHTGHDEKHGYGTKTREWQLDTVALMEKVEQPQADIAFNLNFTKARERNPENRSDFEQTMIMLADDQWISERTPGGSRRGTANDRALTLLLNAIAQHGQIPPTNNQIPPDTPCVTEDLWTQSCKMGFLNDGDPESTARAIRRAKKNLVDRGRVGTWGSWVWAVK